MGSRCWGQDVKVRGVSGRGGWGQGVGVGGLESGGLGSRGVGVGGWGGVGGAFTENYVTIYVS